LILKDHDLPLKLWILEALVERVSEENEHYADIHEDLRIVRAGDRGERSIDYYVDLIDDDDLRVFYDLRLPWKKYFFQMDTVLLTSSFILLVEINNLVGDIFFSRETKQMVRRYNEMKEAFPDPLLQVNQQKLQLHYFLKENKFPHIPIYTIVAFVNRNGILHIEPQNNFHLNNVIPIQEFIFKYKEIEQANNQIFLNENQLEALSELFLTSHVPYDQQNILTTYKLGEEDIMQGVQCKQCQRVGMDFYWAHWICNLCGFKSENAHVKALRDYCLLIGRYATNSDARKFLKLNSRHTTKRLLQNLKLSRVGARKGTKYDLSKLVFDHKSKNLIINSKN